MTIWSWKWSWIRSQNKEKQWSRSQENFGSAILDCLLPSIVCEQYQYRLGAGPSLWLGLLTLSQFHLLYYSSLYLYRLGAGPSVWLGLLTLSQFHLLYYSSRPLPNIFALDIVLHALAAWLAAKISRYWQVIPVPPHSAGSCAE